MLSLAGVLQPFTQQISLCIPNFALLMTKIIKHYLNRSQYPQAPVVLQGMTQNILSLSPEFPIFQANAPFYNLTALPALLQKTKMTKAD